MRDLDPELIQEAVQNLDDILERYAAMFVHLERAELIERLERIRESALAARIILTEHRSVRLD